MPEERELISYPRKRLARAAARGLGRLALPLLCRISVEGRQSFPASGPLIVVGNHVAALEAVLMVVYTPWQVEMLGSVDVPHERLTDLVSRFYGYVPIRRGSIDRPALRQTLGVLEQGGIVGIFPEGGIWDAGGMRAQTGVAWLSYRSAAPVLPVGFAGTAGALGAALQGKRPRLGMRVGELIPAAVLPPSTPRKIYLQQYATRVMDGVRALLPRDDPQLRPKIRDERFELQLGVRRSGGEAENYPPELAIVHDRALARLLHQPGILKIWDVNLSLPVAPLMGIKDVHDPALVAAAIEPVLEYLELDNPYLLKYRFGGQEGHAMEAGLRELLALAGWATREGLTLWVTPLRRFHSLELGREVVQTEQGRFEHWM
jgi:1-acyl-sn-glycerol-3-phosphate acyltransferase